MRGSLNSFLDINQFLDRQLINVQKPGRYVGGEYNQVKKEWKKEFIKIALAFPDIYDIGFSNLGLAILYDEINKRQDALAERLYAPWVDMEALLRKNNIPLFSLENRKPINAFNILGFSIPYETLYTNVLNMLDLSGIPLRSIDRINDNPIIIAGGHTCFNPEPMYAFIDAFVIGEGEEVIHEIIDLVKAEKAKGSKREEILSNLSRINGVYVPAHFAVDYHKDGRIVAVHNFYKPKNNYVTKRFVNQLPPPPTRLLVPNIKIVQEHLPIEIMRGCSRGCRFCQAGIITRPVRERAQDVIIKSVEDAVKKTGYDKVSLLSLSSSDYSQIKGLIESLNVLSKELSFEFSLPSLRIETFTDKLMKTMAGKRKASFTIAPESGSESMRRSINKPISNDNLLQTAEGVFRIGWRNLKLYFMIGFPNESVEDVAQITNLCIELNAINKRVLNGKGKIHISINTFIPKPHTAYQWSPLEQKNKVEEKYRSLIKELNVLPIKIDWPNYDAVFLEAVLSRGDRRLSDVIETAWKKGAKFDAWHEFFNFSLWENAFQQHGLDAGWYVYRQRSKTEVFPWDHIHSGVTKEFLYNEFQRSKFLQLTADCREHCSACGIQNAFGISCEKIRIAV